MLVRAHAATAATAAAAAARLTFVGHTRGAGGPELSMTGARSDEQRGGGRGGGLAVARGAVQGVIEAADPLVVDCPRHKARTCE
jgi:hypothetical protein